jgi:glucokinase
MVKQDVEPITLGVDLGGTKINVGLIDANGQPLSVNASKVPESKDPDMVIEAISAGAEECFSKSGQKAQALGIGVAAQVDQEGVVRTSPNLGWRNVPLKKKLEQKLGLPVYMTNDVRAATWGEWKYGAGKGINDLALLFVGTGVGGGVVTGGKILTGCSNIGGELGHMTIVHNGRKCRCPNKGCLEAYVGGWAIAERVQEAIQTMSVEGKTILTLAGSVNYVTSIILNQAYRRGDLLARVLVQETGRYLATGIINIVNIFNPCRVILGGGVIEGIPELISIAKDIVSADALEPAIESLQIVKSSLGSNAAVIGAATLAQNLLKE